MLDALASAVAVVGSDWRIQVVNRQWERIFGRSAADTIRRDLFAAFPDFAADPSVRMLRALRADGATRHFDLEFAVGDGGRAVRRARNLHR